MLHWDPPHNFFQLFPINLSKLFDFHCSYVTFCTFWLSWTKQQWTNFDFCSQSNSNRKMVCYMFLRGFIKSTDVQPTDHRLTDPTTTSSLLTDPLTTYQPTHRLAIINLRQNRRSDSEHVLLLKIMFYNS